MKILKWIGVILLLLVIGYMIGPQAPEPVLDTQLPKVTQELKALEEEILEAESKDKLIKPGNASRIVWYDSAYQKTPYAVVYLHGFSASAAEGDPVHLEFAKRYGCNLYLPRLFEHGKSGKDPMISLTPEKLVASAKEAIAVAKQLGEQVILMSTSTGSTLSLYIASGQPDIHSLIMFSPNIDVYNSSSMLLTKPWGLQLARTIIGGDYFEFEAPEENQKHWTTRYRIEALIALKSLINATMNEAVFTKVKQPLFMGYYYKNDSLMDKTVSIPRMLEMYDQVGTPSEKKRKVAFPEALSHVVCSKYTSKDLGTVQQATYDFAENILGLTPVANE